MHSPPCALPRLARCGFVLLPLLMANIFAHGFGHKHVNIIPANAPRAGSFCDMVNGDVDLILGLIRECLSTERPLVGKIICDLTQFMQICNGCFVQSNLAVEMI